MGLLVAHGKRQNLESISEVVVLGTKRLYTRDDNIIPMVNEWIPLLVYVVVCYLCDKLPYARFYGFGIILLVLTNYSI